MAAKTMAIQKHARSRSGWPVMPLRRLASMVAESLTAVCRFCSMRTSEPVAFVLPAILTKSHPARCDASHESEQRKWLV